MSPEPPAPTTIRATGILGGIVFLVALLAWPIARRLRDTEATVRRQQVDLANLAQLSQYIVQNLRESIVVVDHENRIRLINESAAVLLGDRSAYPGALLGEASPQLLYLLETWRQRASATPLPSADLRRGRRRPRHPAALRAARRLASLRRSSCFSRTRSCWPPRSSNPSSRGSAGCPRASRTKSAIPVGAMSHAAQLLGESSSLSEEDKRLTEIVRTNGDRVRQIIENVMSMARRENSRPERLIAARPGSAASARSSARPCRSPPERLHDRRRCSATSKCRSTRRSCARSSGTCARTP